MPDPTPQATKRHRLHNAFAESQNARGDRGATLTFIWSATEPERHVRNQERYKPLRALLNGALAFSGQAVDPSGALVSADGARTVPEVQKRAADFRTDRVRRTAVSSAALFERTLGIARLFRFLHSWTESDCTPPI